MTLRRRLILLLSAFAGFAALAAAATIYGIQWQVQGAVDRFEDAVAQATQLDRLRLTLKEQLLLLRDVVDGRHDAAAPYFAIRDEFLTKLQQAARFSGDAAPDPEWQVVLGLADRLEHLSDQCLTHMQAGEPERARQLIVGRIEPTTIPAIEAELRQLTTRQEKARSDAVAIVGATTAQILSLTIVVGVLGACLVVFGASLIRRWLILPIRALQSATEHFSTGDLAHRVSLDDRDELGRLGDAMNDMAASVAEAQANLLASETKHRMLFRNLHDAVVICDRDCRIQEYHDGETGLLGFEGREQTGRHLLEVWPAWRPAAAEWQSVITSVVEHGKRFRAVDIALVEPGQNGREVYADFIVYRVEYGDTRHAAIVVRDVTERHRLQQRVRQAETLEAVGTLGGGLAHDFNNLLTGVIGTLSLLSTEIQRSPHTERIRGALRACWQAAGLSRRLLNFAGTAHGDPLVFRVRDEMQLILNSLDPSFVEGVELHANLEDDAVVRMDRDQFTQVMLNLLRNARDAMPGGGRLSIVVSSGLARDPEHDRTDRPYVILTVSDTGCGMPAEVRRRIFEPFFTTKNRATRRGRGMGLAIVYSIVKNTEGFVQIESEVGKGTTFRVYLPAAEGLPEASESAGDAAPAHHGEGKILLVDEDPMICDVCKDALTRWGYDVVVAQGPCSAEGGAGADLAADCALAIIDTHIPDLSGLALAAELTDRHPALRVILTHSSDECDVPPAIAGRVHGRLSKPFRLDSLASAVSGAMGTNGASRHEAG
jgi:PAS domain S-box-containing protein